jgi:hypothetical protein
MTDGARVLLLRLLDDMDAQGHVSVPRSKLAADLGVAPARVSERIKLARALGLLDVVSQPRPQAAAVYAATIPRQIQGYASRTSEVRQPVSVGGTDSVPQQRADQRRKNHQGYAGRTSRATASAQVKGKIGASLSPSVPYKSSDNSLRRVPPSAGSADADREIRIEEARDSGALAPASPAKPEPSVAHATPTEGRKPWAQLDRDWQDGRIELEDVIDYIDNDLGGLDDAELREVEGMLQSEAKPITARNKVRKQRREYLAARQARECRSCNRPWPAGAQPTEDRVCQACALSAADKERV